MANYTPNSLVKQIELQVDSILRRTNWTEVNERAKKAVEELKQSLVDAKLYSQAYELSEMIDEQIDNARKAKKYLGLARRQILRASEFNVFGAVDVAHLTAQIDQAKADLK